MANRKKCYRIVIAEPSAIIATGLQEIIRFFPEFEVAAITADCCHFAERILQFHPDLVILNPLIVDFNHRHCVEELFGAKNDLIPVALAYQYIEPETLQHYRGVIDITDDREKIHRKLLQVTDAAGTPKVSPGNELSEREKEILISVAKGMINKEIADRHHISIHTVITHRKNITRKTGIKSVAGLTVYALLNNLIDINEVE